MRSLHLCALFSLIVIGARCHELLEIRNVVFRSYLILIQTCSINGSSNSRNVDRSVRVRQPPFTTFTWVFFVKVCESSPQREAFASFQQPNHNRHFHYLPCLALSYERDRHLRLPPFRYDARYDVLVTLHYRC
jgi:hypothetical protein